ncbi:3-beta-hydroxysteroid dehydrogenase [Boeremia exigua]|uniref:3-beta-hydroxysteroid dehydrogenase n=1 Tax=Boeremia exigua TaxID=749465 RepID=UPI001E8E9F8E|nr:3-beta-hydroxysteroid dehydrogenase [Boeremia exigua]KAH6632882.1 3-beta-hydroxysteroid dehydrogenase [Boeremia exigua]
MAPVAVITGGASGMGLAVAQSLAKKGWHVHIADLNESAAQKTATELSGSYTRTDVSSYESLHFMFDTVFQEKGGINFVFANAGIGEKQDFYASTTEQVISSKPPELDRNIDINLKSTINTAYLAQHYMRKNKEKGKACLVFNASIAGIYPVRFCPVYTAAKHGVVGFARAISEYFYREDSIRVNALCPGNVRTNLFKPEEWDAFKMEFIELSQIVSIVEMFLFDESMHGKIVEVAPRDHYFHNAPSYTNENVRITLAEPTFKSMGK